MTEILEGAIFLADAHDNANKKGFLNFLLSLKNGQIAMPPQLFLMGDMFDFLTFTDYVKEFYKEQIELLNEISYLTTIYYFEGNHDYNLRDIFPNITVFDIYSQPQIFITKNGEKISLAHGDIFLKLIDTIFLRFLRLKPFLLTMNLIDKLLNYKISKFILSSQEKKQLVYKIDNFRSLTNRRIYKYKTKFILEGHYHQGVNLEFHEKLYINLSCFAFERSYFIVQYLDKIEFQAIRSPNV